MHPDRLALAAALCVVLPMAFAPAARADAGPAWGAPVGAEPCAAEDRLQQSLAADPGLRARMDLFEALVREAQRKGLPPSKATVAGPSYVIPVVVHIVHQNGPENISDAQVLSQLYALNRDFADSLASGSPAVNTNIQFCLATQLPPASSVTWSTTPGITRTYSAETMHTYGSPSSEVALKAINYLPSTKYLNIWVVNNIAGGGGGVAGYATFPGTVPPTLDGIVIRYTCFGSDSTPFGGPWPNLLPSNPDGKIMTHEAGHWLNVYHTFQGGCSVTGDLVADTPPEAQFRTGCPTGSLTSCTNVNDPIENFMDYTNDACRWAFTAGQTVRMHATLSSLRASLVSGQNLMDVGCDSGLNALIVRSRGQLCAGDTVAYTTPAAGAGWTYAWSFPGGVPSTASTQSVSVVYPSPGVYPATLTVTDGYTASSTNSVTAYVRNCVPVTGPCRQWVFPAHASLDFGTGVPKPVAGRINTSAEPGSAVSDAAGNLLFYADGSNAYTRTNVVMPNGAGLLAGTSSHNGTLIVPRPGSSTQYFLFTVRQGEDAPNTNCMNYSVVDMALNAGFGDIVTGQKNLNVALPGTPNQLLEGMAAIPHCNGTDWWLVSNGGWSASGKLFVTLVTSAGPVSTTAYNIGLGVPGNPFLGAIVPSRDGTRIAGVAAGSGQIAAWNFNRTTGVPTTLLAPTGAWGGYSDIAFSPDGKLLYFNYGGTFGVRQLRIATLEVRDLLKAQLTDINLGPDGLVYIAPGGGATKLHCINYPDNFNTSDLNECGLNLESVPLPAGATAGPFGALPNMPLQCSTVLPADFAWTVSNCLTVNLASLNCSGPWTWNFGDATSGSGQSTSHTYAAPGTYTISLTVAGASPATVMKTITLGMQPVTIAGPATVCDSLPRNYSAVGPAGYTYTWTTSGGIPSFGSGSNVDVAWPLGSGTLTLVAYDSTTGCSTTLTKNVGPCPVCVSPPANMTAWYPLDESSGTLALETVLGANGVDVSGPAHAPAKVRRGRTFSGAGQYVQANDAPGLNFGAGDLTVDAWVRTGAGTGIQSIVEKRSVDPPQGWALYLRDGRLALRLADLTLDTEFWSPTAPFVADGQWHHVAGVLRRSASANGTRLYVDGVPVASFPAWTGGSVTNTEKLLIGATAGFLGPIGYFTGTIDEVELFQRSLATGEINGIALADSMGKCKEYSWVPTVASICRDQASVTLTMQVCNYTTTTQSYSIAFAPLGVGGTCTWPGPAGIALVTPGIVTVPANSCVPVQYTVPRPPGMPLYQTSCYQVTVTNTASNQSTVNTGSIYSSRRWCNLIVKGPVGVGSSGSAARITLRVTNTDDVPVAGPYTLALVPPADGAEEPLVSLNGLPPGVPYFGDVVLGPGESADLDVFASFAEPRAFRFYDVVLSLDEDGDGMLEPVGAGAVTYGPTEPTVSVPPPPVPQPGTLQLGVSPNPVRTHATVRYSLPSPGRVEIALYDVAGREVTAVPPFAAASGPGIATIDCRGLARGVYFVRMRVDGREASRRFMRLE